MAIIGSAYVVVHADTKAVRGEIERAFRGLRGVARDLGEEFGNEFADAFGDSLRDRLDGIIEDSLDQDVTRSAERTAADYADQFSDSLNQELSDVIARTLADDSDALENLGRSDAEAYSKTFSDRINERLGNIVSDTISDADLASQGDKEGTDYGDAFSSSFKRSLDENLDNAVGDAIQQDLSSIGRNSAADYADQFSESLSAELADVVAQTLDSDSDGLRRQGERDAGAYTTGFADAIRVNFDGLIEGVILGGDDLTELGRRDAADYAAGFRETVTGERVPVSVDQNGARNAAAIAGAVVTSQLADSFDEDSGGVTRAATLLGARAGSGFTGSFGNVVRSGFGAIPPLPTLFGDEEEIRAASAAVTQLIGLGNLLGPAIAQLVAGISALAEGLFAVAAATAEATPALITLPSLLGALLQGAFSTAIAFQGMGAAIKTALSPDSTPADLREDLKTLTPSAQDFVLALQDVSKEFTKLRKVAQENLFEGLDKSLRQLVDSTFPVLERVLARTTSEINELAKVFTERFTDPGNLRNFETVARTNVQTIGQLGRALISLGEGFNSALAAASPLINRFTAWIGSVSAGISAFLQVGSASGELTDTFNRAGDVAAKLGDIFGNLTDALVNLGRASAPAGQALLSSFEDATANLADLTSEALSSGDAFLRFGQIAENTKAIGNLFNDLAKILLEIGASKSVEQTFNTLREGIPAVRDIVNAFNDAGPALAELAVQAFEFIAAFTETEGIQIFLETLTVILETLTAIIELPVVSQLVAAFIPLVAISRGISFFFNSTRIIFQGLIGNALLMTQRTGLFAASLIEARTAGTTMGATVNTAFNSATISANRATLATNGLALAMTRVTASGAVGTGLAGLAAGTRGSLLVGPVSKLGAATSKTARATSALRNASAALIGVPIGPWGLAATAAIAGIGFAYFRARNEINEYNDRVADSSAVIAEQALTQKNISASTLESTDAFKQYSDTVGATNVNYEAFSKAITGSQGDVQALSDDMVRLRTLTIELGESKTEYSVLDAESSANIAYTIEAIEDLKAKIEEEKAALDESARAAGFASYKHLELSAAAEGAAKAVDDAISTYDSMTDAAYEGRLANAELSVSLRNLRTNLDNLQTRKGRLTDQGFIDFTQEFKQMRELSNQLARLGRVNQAENALLGVRDALKELKIEGDLSANAYRRLLHQFDLTPDEIGPRVLDISIVGLTSKIADLKELRASLPEDSKARIIITDNIKELQRKLDDLEDRWMDENHPHKVPVQADADTDEAERKINETANKKYPKAKIDTDAVTKAAIDDIYDAAGLDYPDAQIKAASQTGEAVGKIINDVSRRAYPEANVRTEANTDPAIAEIGRVTGRAYNASVRVTADTSLVALQVAAAVRKASAAIGITVAGGAKGGILPGYSPGRDIIPAMLSPGEAVLRPQAVRAIGPDFINALNRDWNRVARLLRDMWRGRATGFAEGGIVGTGPTLNDFSRVANSIIASENDGGLTITSTKTDTPLVGDTYNIYPAPGMSEVELAAKVSRRQSFVKRRGT